MSDYDFSSAFKQGIDASLLAEAARTEIREVIQDLSKQISSATEGQLEIEIRAWRQSPGFNYFGVIDELAKLTMPRTEETKAKSSDWISARNVKSSDATFVKLAQWEGPHEGYPCTVSVNGRDYRCHDKEALQKTLATMLSDAWVGEKLRQLLNRPRKPEGDSPAPRPESSG